MRKKIDVKKYTMKTRDLEKNQKSKNVALEILKHQYGL